MANKDKPEEVTPVVAAQTPQSPRLGDTIKVLGNADAPPRIDAHGFFPTDKPIEVVVTTRIVKLLRDGDLRLI